MVPTSGRDTFKVTYATQWDPGFKKGIERQRKEGERRRGGRKGERKVSFFKNNALRCSTEELSKHRNILAAQAALWLLLTTYS